MEQNKDQSGAAVRGEAVAEQWHAPGMGEIHSHDHKYMIECMREIDDPDQDFVADDELANKVCAILNGSAPAADAPSEPSELVFAQCDGVPFRHLEYGDGLFFTLNAGKSRAADALDIQPTEPYKLESNEQYNVQMAAIGAAAFGYCKLDGIQPEYMTQPLRDVVALYEKYAALRASSQPTDGGVRNG